MFLAYEIGDTAGAESCLPRRQNRQCRRGALCCALSPLCWRFMHSPVSLGEATSRASHVAASETEREACTRRSSFVCCFGQET